MVCPAETCGKTKSLLCNKASKWTPRSSSRNINITASPGPLGLPAGWLQRIPLTQNPWLTVFVTRLAHRQKHPDVAPGLALLTHSRLIPNGQPGPHRAWSLHTPCSSGSARASALHAGSKAGQDTCLTVVLHVTHQHYALGWDLRYFWSRSDK